MSNVKVVDEVNKSDLSKWGICEVTVTPQVLDEIRQGKSLIIDVMDEYSVCIKIGADVGYEEVF
jgi:hypothetical protein